MIAFGVASATLCAVGLVLGAFRKHWTTLGVAIGAAALGLFVDGLVRRDYTTAIAGWALLAFLATVRFRT